jgi:hypothetical protein
VTADPTVDHTLEEIEAASHLSAPRTPTGPQKPQPALQVSASAKFGNGRRNFDAGQ